jgi:hypothetical protein
MIYETPSYDALIRQGDIFIGLPRIDLSLQEMVLARPEGERLAAWKDLAFSNEPMTIIVPVRPVAAIVATQDCDAVRSHDITLCEIRQFRDVEGMSKNTSSPKSWKNIITQHARINQKWFYLPPDPTIGFTEKMAVDFLVTLRVAREDLESLRSLRRGRLNATADEHFRERIGEFFRRYPYDEWYPLNGPELDEYTKEYSDARPFPWQENATEANQ